MTTTKETSWRNAIRRYVFEMLILLVILGLIAIGYRAWILSSSNNIRRYINNYHLASTAHYLKAIEEFREVQILLIHESARKYIDTELQLTALASMREPNYSVMYYIILQKIRAGLELHRNFADGRFGTLTAKLARQVSNYEESSNDYVQNGVASDQMIADIRGLLTTLNQLVRLHSVMRDDRLTKLGALENRQTLTYYVLLSVLLLAGLLITRRGFVAINVVITKHREAEDKIRYQAHFDNLTDLPNRLLSLDRLNQLINEAQRAKDKVAVLFLDLDDFKKINDTLGHDIGDKLLIEAADRLKNTVRSGDTVGRLGGDEFIVILGKITDVADVHIIVENLIDHIRNAYNIEGREMILTASVGISIYPEDGEDASKLLRSADSAMYHSKALGRNTYSYFTEAMNRDASRRLALEEQIHGALDRGEFRVFYQQQVDLSRNKITGAEALLRWHNSALGSISPEEFIPIAEQTGLIVSIGQFVLTEALSMTAQWQREQDPEFRISVNLSPRQFRDHHLVSKIEKAMQQYGISSQHLELEITEGVLMSGHDYIDLALTELNNLGVSIVMDDFGTGYSSLSYLRSYPFDVIKIDRSFIRDIVDDSKDRELINAAISMAHALKLKVVAEGVETEEQLAYLKELSCDYVQGYLFGKPIPGEGMRAVLASSSTNHPFGQRQLEASKTA
ncbi:MAG: putative bifunctional diguanylate cyclase/phosphodiesterase [Pseudomonadales bacterium]